MIIIIRFTLLILSLVSSSAWANIVNVTRYPSGTAVPVCEENNVSNCTPGNFCRSDGTNCPGGITGFGDPTAGDPTALVGPNPVYGSATTAMRSDSAPALDENANYSMGGNWFFAPSTGNTQFLASNSAAFSEYVVDINTVGNQNDIGDSNNLAFYIQKYGGAVYTSNNTLDDGLGNSDVLSSFNAGNTVPGQGSILTTPRPNGVDYPQGYAQIKGGDEPSGLYSGQVGAIIRAYGGDYNNYGYGSYLGGSILLQLGVNYGGGNPRYLYIEDYLGNILMSVDDSGNVTFSGALTLSGGLNVPGLLNTGSIQGDGGVQTTSGSSAYPQGNGILKGGDNLSGGYTGQYGAQFIAGGADYDEDALGGEGESAVAQIGVDPAKPYDGSFNIQSHAGTKIFRIGLGGHITFHGTAPTIASNACGSTVQATMATSSTDSAGQIIVGNNGVLGTVSSCVMTFANNPAWPNAPFCVVSDNSRIVSVQPATTTTSLTLTVITNMQNDTISYICQGGE